MLVDSHCHLNYLDDPQRAIRDAHAAGVTEMLCIGVNEAGAPDVLACADNDGIWATLGEHPDGVSGDPAWLTQHLTDPRVVAVGETGLDYLHAEDPDSRKAQYASFDAHLAIAADADLPVVVHTRAAEADTRELLQRHKGVRGVLHCFTESWSLASVALDLGWFVSISGIVTFKNAANVRDVAQRIPDERLLIETDAPWLAPAPHRGTQNAPALLPHTAAFLSELKGIDVEALASMTRRNFFALFTKTRET